ncbi:hypothetical protein Lal_00041498 [Lupinus albus]|nr:hypothetical protein Lal_00041498 [Lupinus albus]
MLFLAQARQPSLRRESSCIPQDFTLPGEPLSPRRESLAQARILQYSPVFHPPRKGRFKKFHKEYATCHECGKVGHMRYTCPTYLKKIEHDNKKDSRDFKAKKAYITWDTPEEDITSTRADEESNKLCLMVQNLNSSRVIEQDESSELSGPSTCKTCKTLEDENTTPDTSSNPAYFGPIATLRCAVCLTTVV